MSETIDRVGEAIDRVYEEQPAATRRQFVAGAAAVVGGLAVATIPSEAVAARNEPKDILNIAATAEVLATIVNTVGAEQNFFPEDPTTQRNIETAAREELIHWETLRAFGGKQLTKKIWVPDAVFASGENLLNTLQVGDQIFINAYLIATKKFGNNGEGILAAYTAEFMGVEAVHRALARQSLGQLGNDRAFMKFFQIERAPGAPNQGQRGFVNIEGAVRQLQNAGFGFGKRGATPGRFYDFDEVRERTPNDPDINVTRPNAGRGK